MSDAGPGVRAGRQAVHQQVVRMLESLERDHPGATAQLARRTVDQLGSWEEVSVRTVPAAQADAGCSVAGAYIAAAHPPILAIADAVSPRRRAFTGLHELGHHLQQTDYALMEALIELEDSSVFEDAACDEFAAEVLLPAHLVNQALAGGVTAPAVTALWRAAEASRAAACVRAVQKLACPGHVILLDDAGTVQFAAANRLPPVRRGSSQVAVPVVQRSVRDRRHQARDRRTRLVYRDGILGGQELYSQAADIGGMVVLVLVTEHAPWETGFHLPAVEDRPRGRDWVCQWCGHEFETFKPACSRCHAPTCPECARCDCERVREKTCNTCFLVKLAHLFPDGSDRCTDCS